MNTQRKFDLHDKQSFLSVDGGWGYPFFQARSPFDSSAGEQFYAQTARLKASLVARYIHTHQTTSLSFSLLPEIRADSVATAKNESYKGFNTPFQHTTSEIRFSLTRVTCNVRFGISFPIEPATMRALIAFAAIWLLAILNLSCVHEWYEFFHLDWYRRDCLQGGYGKKISIIYSNVTSVNCRLFETITKKKV